MALAVCAHGRQASTCSECNQPLREIFQYLRTDDNAGSNYSEVVRAIDYDYYTYTYTTQAQPWSTAGPAPSVRPGVLMPKALQQDYPGGVAVKPEPAVDVPDVLPPRPRRMMNLPEVKEESVTFGQNKEDACS